ncbi:hypothetical protein FRC16_001585 [Serendipita sp. 398]|nr:hypothetical protein FRC16_001585 [Serendipita sp. 398]
MVEKLPLDCVNVIVWNVLIAAAIKAARYKLAFELYYDMKRRHIQPNSRTFTTLFVGLSKIDDWTPYANILGRVFNTYDQLLAHFEKLRLTNPESPDITPWPLNGYLTLLGKTNHYARMWDVFYSMEGRLAPDEVTYSIMLRAIQSRLSLDLEPVETALDIEEKENQMMVQSETWSRFDDLDDAPEETLGLISRYFRPVVEKDGKESVHVKNAADARLLWEHLVKATRREPNRIQIDSSHVSLVLDLLAKGKPSDHLVAFDILHHYVDLQPPLSPSKISSSYKPSTTNVAGRLPITSFIFSSLLDLCVRSARVESAINYFQLLAEKKTAKNVIDWKHMLHVMRAFAMRRAPKGQVPDAREAISALEWMLREQEVRETTGNGGLNPAIDHFVYALTAAWKAADMNSALRVVELMTGMQRDKFINATPPVRESWKDRNTKQFPLPVMPQTPRYSRCRWNTTCMALLIKTAGATQRREDIRIALRILYFFGPSRFFGSQTGPQVEDAIAAQTELAKRTIWCIDYMLNTGDEERESAVWKKLRDIAADQLKRLAVTQVRNEEKAARQEELRRMETVEDGDMQLLVPVNGRRSGWATGM